MKQIKPIVSITVGPKREMTEGVVADPDFVWSGCYPHELVRLHRRDLSRSGTFPPLVRVRRVSASTVFGGIGVCRAVSRSDGMLTWEAKSLLDWQCGTRRLSLHGRPTSSYEVRPGGSWLRPCPAPTCAGFLCVRISRWRFGRASRVERGVRRRPVVRAGTMVSRPLWQPT